PREADCSKKRLSKVVGWRESMATATVTTFDLPAYGAFFPTIVPRREGGRRKVPAKRKELWSAPSYLTAS
ncbi:MAG TPA: hypothetical protein VHV53_07805, partial [Solirubrobacterales bacterium]|nr:hypothetical protein [Solirubrobacterales bacterium]